MLQIFDSASFNILVDVQVRKKRINNALLGSKVRSQVFLMNTNAICLVHKFTNSVFGQPKMVTNKHKLTFISNDIHQVSGFICLLENSYKAAKQKVSSNWNDSNNKQPKTAQSNITSQPFPKNSNKGNQKSDRQGTDNFNKIFFHTTNIQILKNE